MKLYYWIIIIFCLNTSTSWAQKKLVFNYDAAGNQTERKWIVLANPNSPPHQAAKISKEDVLKINDLEKALGSNEGVTSYFKASPNPVESILRVEWNESESSYITRIAVFSLNGTMLIQQNSLQGVTNTELSFVTLQSGVYLLVGYYNNGKKETLKILKP